MFLFRRADRLDILALVAAVTLLPTLAIWAMEELAGLVSATVRGHLHLVSGPAADLVYRTPASAGPVGGAPATAVLDDRRPLGEIRPGSGTVPALVTGRLTAPPPPGATVLVAVNGRIGGGSEPFPERPGEPAVRFAVLTPDFLWKAGAGHGQLQLYLLHRSDGGPRLQPVSVPAE